MAKLHAAFATRRTRERFVPGVEWTVRTSTTDRSMRVTWPDGTSVQLWFTDKGPTKSQVQVQHSGLASKAQAETAKREWHGRLDALARPLKG